MAQGGVRKPGNPAPVGLPGALSQRTDGGPADSQPIRYISGLPYGEGQAMVNTQSSAPMEAASPTPSVTQSQMAQTPGQAPAQPQLTPLGAPTANPSEPVTAGANAGAGPDMSALNLQSPNVASYQNAKSTLQALSKSPNASPALQYLAQAINGVY